MHRVWQRSSQKNGQRTLQVEACAIHMCIADEFLGTACRCLGKSPVTSPVSRLSPARDGAAGTTLLPLCSQTSMTAATSYTFIIPLFGIICEFFSFSAIIEIGDTHDFSSFSTKLSSGILVSMFYCCFVCFLNRPHASYIARKVHLEARPDKRLPSHAPGAV